MNLEYKMIEFWNVGLHQFWNCKILCHCNDSKENLFVFTVQ